jgi:hypothetical protein
VVVLMRTIPIKLASIQKYNREFGEKKIAVYY